MGFTASAAPGRGCSASLVSVPAAPGGRPCPHPDRTRHPGCPATTASAASRRSATRLPPSRFPGCRSPLPVLFLAGHFLPELCRGLAVDRLQRLEGAQDLGV